uniref:WEB family protein n=1 Tax=Salix viminalis TaxID=40686 RepID=A0A6N2K5P7_SALVM
METPTPPPKPEKDGSSSVDASRPFRSVREAVAIFDERVLVFGTLKKLEAGLEETRAELKLLKEREYATEIALASLNAEVHMNMSKLAAAEAAAAKKAAESTRAAGFERKRKEDLLKEEERRRELTIRMDDFPTLAQILDLGGSEEGSFRGKKERKVMKKKPIVPLVGDFFFKKKGSSNSTLNTILSILLKIPLIL